MKQSHYIRKITLSAMFLALGLVLPMLTGEIPAIGKMLLPMHIPVLLCGMICGWQFGLVVGFILPLSGSMIFGMPPLYPVAISMAFELATYGAVIGIVYHLLKKSTFNIYLSLIVAMLAGRAVWGIVNVILTGTSSSGFTWALFFSGAFVNAAIGIAIQIVLIPIIMIILQKVHALDDRR